MTELSVEQIRRFRLAVHHLDRVYANADIPAVVGACGMQNSPPGAWETALFNRVPGCSQAEMERLLYEEKVLLQAWSMRGAPLVFPASESRTFFCVNCRGRGTLDLHAGDCPGAGLFADGF